VGRLECYWPHRAFRLNFRNPWPNLTFKLEEDKVEDRGRYRGGFSVGCYTAAISVDRNYLHGVISGKREM